MFSEYFVHGAVEFRGRVPLQNQAILFFCFTISFPLLKDEFHLMILTRSRYIFGISFFTALWNFGVVSPYKITRFGFFVLRFRFHFGDICRYKIARFQEIKDTSFEHGVLWIPTGRKSRAFLQDGQRVVRISSELQRFALSEEIIHKDFRKMRTAD